MVQVHVEPLDIKLSHSSAQETKVTLEYNPSEGVKLCEIQGTYKTPATRMCTSPRDGIATGSLLQNLLNTDKRAVDDKSGEKRQHQARMNDTAQ